MHFIPLPGALVAHSPAPGQFVLFHHLPPTSRSLRVPWPLSPLLAWCVQLEESRRKGKGKQPVEEEAVQVDYEDEGDALPPCPRSPTRSATSEAGDLTCAICLGDIRLEDMAMVKGCDHIYCGESPSQAVLPRNQPLLPALGGRRLHPYLSLYSLAMTLPHCIAHPVLAPLPACM